MLLYMYVVFNKSCNRHVIKMSLKSFCCLCTMYMYIRHDICMYMYNVYTFLCLLELYILVCE